MIWLLLYNFPILGHIKSFTLYSWCSSEVDYPLVSVANQDVVNIFSIDPEEEEQDETLYSVFEVDEDASPALIAQKYK